jgi:tripartite ATP-independent transporter DctM subunit
LTLFLFLGLLLILFLLGVPVAFSLGLTSLAIMLYESGLSLRYEIIAQRMFYGVNNFTLLAVPFFIFAGKLMNTGGITTRIFGFANALVGHWRGGLGHVNVLASIVFAGMSGAAVSDAAGLGIIELKAMRDAGYDNEFSCAITAASSTIGPIIPPSIPMVFYGVVGGVSVGSLFLAGFIPGLIMGLTLMIMVSFYAKKRDYPAGKKATLKEIAIAFREAVLPLLTPVIILGGIYTGAFTPTEASVIAVLYAMLVGVVIYRELPLREIPVILRETMRDTAVMAFVVSCAFVYGWLLVRSGLPAHFAKLMFAITDNPKVFLLIVNVFLLVVGCFMEPVVAILILTPIFSPMLRQLAINPIHFGVVMVLNLMIGLLTPPFGLVLYVMVRIGDISFDRMVKATMPFLIPLLLTLLLITLVPEIVLFLPRWAMR